MLSVATIHDELMEFVRETGPDCRVCFDFFDTLIRRTVSPEYTKKIAAEQLCEALGLHGYGQEVYTLRSRLEREMCRANEAAGYDLEFNLLSLAPLLYHKILGVHQRLVQRLSEERFVDLLLNIELAVEKAVQVPCPQLADILRKLKKTGCRTILISDFYLPGSWFKELTRYHGFDRYIDDMYVSADYLITKGSGKLYDHIADSQDTAPHHMIMIGDNPHADKRMAESRGVRGLLIDRKEHRKTYTLWEEQLALPQTEKRVRQRAGHLVRQSATQLFPEMALSVWHFIDKLYRNLTEAGGRPVAFLSREGEFLKTLFEQYQEQKFGRQVIESRYLLVSRKSTYIASLKPLAEEPFSKLFFQYRDIAPRDFLLSLNFTEHDALRVCSGAGVDFQARVVGFPDSDVFQKILQDEGFAERYEELRVSQKENLKRYIRALGFDVEREGLTLVDVGWKGSMQENLFQVYDGAVDVTGYYVGLLQSAVEHSRLQKIGLLFSEIPEKSTYFSVYNNNRSLFEMIFGASHGSAEGYFSSMEAADARNNPQQAIHEEVDTAEGSLFIATVEEPEEARLFSDVIHDLQQAIKETFSRLNLLFLESYLPRPDDEWFARKHARMVYFPKSTEIDFFQSLYHLENFGVFEFTRFDEQESLSLRRRVFNMRSVIRDPALLEVGFWPPVILRYLGLDFYRHIDGFRRYYRDFSG